MIMITFFEHNGIHKYTREVMSRKENSLIDYILADRDTRRGCQRKGADIGSDHYMIIANITSKYRET